MMDRESSYDFEPVGKTSTEHSHPSPFDMLPWPPVWLGPTNVFRLVGDGSHLLAIIILLFGIIKRRSVRGISGPSQILFSLVFITRYLDLVTNFISVYNTVMKVFYILTSLLTVYLVYGHFKDTWDRKLDNFRMELLLVPCGCLALFLNHEFSALEVLWTFSIYLEAVSILPQLFLTAKTDGGGQFIYFYLVPLGAYRAFYIANWVYRYYTEGFLDIIAVVGGCLETGIYSAFFLYVWIAKDSIGEEKYQLLQ